MFEKFLEILWVDATHKLIDLKLPLYLLLIADGTG